MIPRLTNKQGFTLIELVIVILVLGVIAVVATRRMQESIATARFEQTKREMDQLARAIVGDAALYASGERVNYGYVGDVGSLPPNLDALVTNPGGYSTWNGPYIQPGPSGTDFKLDGWGTAYVYTDTLLRSTGSGGNIDKLVAGSSTELLSNPVEGTVIDANQNLPGAVYKDSMLVRLTYPDGSGSTATATVNPTANGYFSFAGIPIGSHSLKIIYMPDTDTATYSVAVNPGRTTRLNIVFPADLW